MFDDYRTYEYKVEVLTLPDERMMSTRALEDWELVQLVFMGSDQVQPWVHVFKREKRDRQKMSIIPPESYMSGGDVTLVGVILGLIAIAIFFYAWEFIMNNILNHEIFERNLFY